MQRGSERVKRAKKVAPSSSCPSSERASEAEQRSKLTSSSSFERERTGLVLSPLPPPLSLPPLRAQRARTKKKSKNEAKKTKKNPPQNLLLYLEHPRLEVCVEHVVDPEELPVPRGVRVLPAAPPRVLEVAVGGVGAGQEHVGGDVAEVGPELVKGLGGACFFFFFLSFVWC